MHRLGGYARSYGFIGWFGLRGIGSLYYLSYALSHGSSGAPDARLIAAAVLCTGTASIFIRRRVGRAIDEMVPARLRSRRGVRLALPVA